MGVKGGMGTHVLLLMLTISASFFIMGFRTTSTSFLGQYVDIGGDNQTDEPLNPWTDIKNLTEGGGVGGSDFDVDASEGVKSDVKGLQEEGGGIFATSFITESFIPFIKSSVAILGIVLATPYDFAFNLGFPSEVALLFGTALYVMLLVAVLAYFTGRDF